MTSTDPDYYTPASRGDVLRDVVALLLLVLCAAGITWAAFETDWRLGVCALSVTAGAVGVGLGLSR